MEYLEYLKETIKKFCDYHYDNVGNTENQLKAQRMIESYYRDSFQKILEILKKDERMRASLNMDDEEFKKKIQEKVMKN